MTPTTAQLFENDRVAYLESLRASLDEFVYEGDAYTVLAWATRSAGGVSADLISVAGVGAFMGAWEDWRPDLASPAVGVFPGHRENEYQRFAEMEMPEEILDLVYVAHLIRVTLDDFASDRGLGARLDYVFEHVVLDLYEEGSRMGEEKREIIRTFFDLGIGVELRARAKTATGGWNRGGAVRR